MMKKLLILALSLCFICLLLLRKSLMAPAQIYPYPYIFQGKAPNVPQAIKESNVLIMGDRMAKGLLPYLQRATPEISKKAQYEMTVFDWSGHMEGMHRTLLKIKQISKLPPIVIYHGASSEFIESLFNKADYKNILENFKKTKNDILLSILMMFPWPSKFIYHPVTHILLPQEIPLKKQKGALKDFKALELNFLIFEYEFLEFIEYIIDQGSELIVITTPLNLKVLPKGDCKSLETHETAKELLKIQKLLEQGNSKEAYSLSEKLLTKAPSHPMVHHSLSQSLLRLGKTRKSVEHRELATVFECDQWRGNAVYNAIMKKLVSQYDLKTVDFHQITNQYFGKRNLFYDELFPHNLYYIDMVQELKEKLIKLLRQR